MRGYSGAVATSLTISVSLNLLFKGMTSKMTGGKQFIASTFFNLLAVSLANASNVGLMRYKELDEGITVKDNTGYEHGKSKTVGKLALTQTIITRITIPFFVTAGPAAAITLMKAKNLMPRNKMVSILLEGSLCAMALGISLPIAIALFPQEGSVKSEDLEEQFHDLKDAHGNSITQFYFNKGL